MQIRLREDSSNRKEVKKNPNLYNRQMVHFPANQTMHGGEAGSVSPVKDLAELKTVHLSAMHKTVMDGHSTRTSGLSKLPGLVIKGEGDNILPISDRSSKFR